MKRYRICERSDGYYLVEYRYSWWPFWFSDVRYFGSVPMRPVYQNPTHAHERISALKERERPRIVIRRKEVK